MVCGITATDDRFCMVSRHRVEFRHDSQQFRPPLRAFQKRTPFKAFTVELVSGDRFQVDHPGAVVFRDGVALFVAKGGVPIVFDHEGVAQVLGEPAPQQSA